MALLINFKRRDSTKKSKDLSHKNQKNAKKQKFAKKSKFARFKDFMKKKSLDSAIALLYALIFSLPIYLNIFTYLSIDENTRQISAYLPYINAIFALLAVASALSVDKKYRFFFGFFVGILWFYWMVMSFTHSYSSITHFIPPALILIGIIYGVVFYFLLFFNNKIWRIISLSIIGYIPIFGFDWLVVEALFSFSIFSVKKISFIFILVCVAICLHFLRKMRESIKNNEREYKKRNIRFAIFALILLIFVIDFSHFEVQIPPKIAITQMNVNQQIKWSEERQVIVERNFGLIDEAIARGDKMIILPETAFPFALNLFENIVQNLREKSRQITIITGSWWVDSYGGAFNSTYIFENGALEVKNKTFLAPFGEYLPLPKFIASIFSKITGISYNLKQNQNVLNDARTAILDFRSAICYEGTKREAYSENPRFMVLISNNAWFAPSIEPILQMMLMKYYARLHGTTILHSSNGSKSMIITPNVGLNFIQRD
ncbi:apolipoprotein N-acyltransferase [Helicobacter sp. 23-1045]